MLIGPKPHDTSCARNTNLLADFPRWCTSITLSFFAPGPQKNHGHGSSEAAVRGACQGPVRGGSFAEKKEEKQKTPSPVCMEQHHFYMVLVFRRHSL